MIIHVRVFHDDGTEQLGNCDGQMITDKYKTYAGFRKYVIMAKGTILNNTVLKLKKKVVVERLNRVYQQEPGMVLEIFNDKQEV